MKKVVVYIKGSCSDNKEAGGWGAILSYNGHEKELSGGEANASNYRMELTAIIFALESLKEPCIVELYCKSKLIIDSLEKGWAKSWQENEWIKPDKNPALNPDLWERLLLLTAKHTMHYYVSKDQTDMEKKYNKRCSVLARAEWESLVKGKQKTMKIVNIYTDGACSGNPGPGGWGAILCHNGREKEISGGEAQTTNNRMELTAVIYALKALKEPCVVELYSDSKYVISALEEGWAVSWRKKNWIKSNKNPALNPDLWEELLNLIEKHVMRYHWVKGHADNEYNNRCDALAVMEREKYV